MFSSSSLISINRLLLALVCLLALVEAASGKTEKKAGYQYRQATRRGIVDRIRTHPRRLVRPTEYADPYVHMYGRQGERTGFLARTTVGVSREDRTSFLDSTEFPGDRLSLSQLIQKCGDFAYDSLPRANAFNVYEKHIGLGVYQCDIFSSIDVSLSTHRPHIGESYLYYSDLTSGSVQQRMEARRV